jgi:hypothetical protein
MGNIQSVSSLESQLNGLRNTNTRLISDESSTNQNYGRVMDNYRKQEKNKISSININKRTYNNYKTYIDENTWVASFGNAILSLFLGFNEETANRIALTEVEKNQYKTIYYTSLLEQNKILRDDYDRINGGNLSYNKKSEFQAEAMAHLNTAYKVFFYTFYSLLLFIIYKMFSMQSTYSTYYKLFIIILIGLYPFYISIIEKLLYISWKYLYAFMTSTVYNDLSESKRAVIEQTTDLHVDGPPQLIPKL